MNKIVILSLSLAIVGCSSIVDRNVYNLEGKNGSGALAIITTFDKSTSKYPCRSMSLDMYKKSEQSANPVVLSFSPDVKEDYIIFDNIEPETYVIKSIRCFPPSGYVFYPYSSYIESDVYSVQEIKPNKLSLSWEALIGVEYEDGSFKYNLVAYNNNPEFLKLIIDEERIAGWDFNVLADE